MLAAGKKKKVDEKPYHKHQPGLPE